MTITELAREAHETNKSKGFVDDDINIDQKLLLAIGELVEAQNELRNGHAPTEIYYPLVDAGRAPNEAGHNYVPGSKPEGFPIEIADAMIRLAHLAEHLGIDLEGAIKLKMEYNKTRPFKHGGKRF